MSDRDALEALLKQTEDLLQRTRRQIDALNATQELHGTRAGADFDLDGSSDDAATAADGR